jgi:hypothetical protein
MKLTTVSAFRRTWQELIYCAVFQEIDGWSHTHARGFGEVVRAVHDVGAKALGKFIDCYLQPVVPSEGAEKVKLHHIVGT